MCTILYPTHLTVYSAAICYQPKLTYQVEWFYRKSFCFVLFTFLPQLFDLHMPECCCIKRDCTLSIVDKRFYEFFVHHVRTAFHHLTPLNRQIAISKDSIFRIHVYIANRCHCVSMLMLMCCCCYIFNRIIPF